MQDLLDVNKMVRSMQQHSEVGLQFMSGIKRPILITYTDASRATRRYLSSQGGTLTILTDASIMHGTEAPFSVISYVSRKLARKARSSTSAEVQNCGNAVDQHEFVKQTLFDFTNFSGIDLSSPEKDVATMKSCLIIDAKNMYDALNRIETSGLQLEEKRTLGIKERLRKARIFLRWVDSDQELADGLTKPFHAEQILKAVRWACWKITFDPNYVSAEKKRILRKQATSGN